MKIVIAGSGEVGFHIAEQLITGNQDVILIEKDRERAKFVTEHLDCLVVHGEASSVEVLVDAGMSGADIFIAVTDLDEVNMVSCLVVASEFDTPVKIARVRNVAYKKAAAFKHGLRGIDYIVNPEIEAARAIMNTIEHGATSDILVFEETDIQLRNIYVDERSFFKGKTLKDIRRDLPYSFIVAGVSRGDEIVIPHGGTVIMEGDHVYLVSSRANLERILAISGRPKRALRNIVIVGGSKIGRYVCEQLLRSGRKVKMVDKDYEKCKRLAAQFPEALVINEDISEEKIFEEEQLHTADLLIATTNDEALNMLTSIYAKQLGIKRVIPLVNKTNYVNIAANLGIDATVSPKTSSVSAILKVIRRGHIKSVHTIFDGKAEAIEFVVPVTSAMVGKAVKDLQLPFGALVVAVNRQNKNYVPNGDFIIEGGDNVITFAKTEQVGHLEEVFSH
ncbi:MAG: Trk system potassium transporter TrkA [Deltaproteobacteria bacterium]|nr:Trk system potassium transporter TrkA [Candidatus Anaeroferrophillus wilburensis]MBN2890089.1 Trk system potassium transporter TrkA [Deltaproteobacteria bacterium]